MPIQNDDPQERLDVDGKIFDDTVRRKLWAEWKALGIVIGELSYLFQNKTPISHDEYEAWKERARKQYAAFEALAKKSINLIES